MIPIRKTINDIITREVDSDKVYILLSGGVDSQSVLFSCLELGKEVVAVSFTREDHESRDFLCGKGIAEQLGLEFLPVLLPTDLETISEKILYLGQHFDCKLKTDFECMYPMILAYDAINKHSGGSATIVSGLGADTYYLLSKKASIHYKHRPDEYRDLLYFNPNYSQRCKHEKLSDILGFNHVMPYFRDEVYNLFKGKSKKEVNSPLEKNDVREQYKEELIEKLHYKHTSFQKGDSGISDMFEALIDSEWNIKDWRSVTGIYNSIAKGEINKPLNKEGKIK